MLLLCTWVYRYLFQSLLSIALSWSPVCLFFLLGWGWKVPELCGVSPLTLYLRKLVQVEKGLAYGQT